MSVVQVEKALHHFATTRDGRAIVMKGDWGTGKTFIWQKTLENHRGSFAKANYSYVSLFGLSSLADLKRTIFTNIVERDKAGEISSPKSILRKFNNWDFSEAKGLIRKLSGQTKDTKVPFIGGIGGMVEAIQFANLTDTLICIDDFERRSKSLSAREVLGLISNLVESRKCSVILILNENAIKDDKDEFFSFNEKVFDYEVVYKPEVKECVEIVFPSSDESLKVLAQNIVKLEINNIRLLKKIRLFNDMLSQHLKNAPAEVTNKAMLILPLAVLCMYGDGKCPVDIDFISDASKQSHMTPLYNISADEKAKSDAIMAKVKWLKDYGFSGADDLDLAIISLVKRGYADEDELQLVLIALEESIKHAKDMSLLSDAWAALHGSFGDDQPVVTAMFDDAVKVCIHKMNIREIENLYWLYTSLSQQDKADELLKVHLEDARLNGWYFNRNEIRPWPAQPAVALALEKYIDQNIRDVSIDELMEKSYMNAGFMPSVIKEFSKKTADEFYGYFLNAHHPYVLHYAKNCLDLSNTQYSDDESNKGVKHIFMCTYEAIQRLSKTSQLNAVRASRFSDYDPVYQRYLDEGKRGNWA